MKFSELFKAACEIAPIELSEAFVRAEDGYDTSGIIVETRRDIKKVLFSLDLSLGCAKRAAEGGFDAVVTHHPAIYNPISSLNYTDTAPVLICAGNDIGVISMHLNLDIADRGIDFSLAEKLGAKEQKIITVISGNNGYGRLFEIEEVPFFAYKRRVSEEFGTENIMVFGKKDKAIKSVASFCGAGCDIKELDLASGADLIVSADIKHHVIKEALDRGFAVMQLTHYSSEVFGMKRFADDLKAKLSGVEMEFFDDEQY